MGQGISEIIREIFPQAIGIANIFAHLGAFSVVLHLLWTRMLAVGVITLELVVLNTFWPNTETTMSPPDQHPTPLSAEKGISDEAN